MPPPNDNFGSAIAITDAAGQIIGTNVGATAETGEPPGNGKTVWWKWTCPADGNYNFTLAETVNGTFTDFKSRLQVFTGPGSIGNLTEQVYLQDESNGIGGGYEFAARVAFSAAGNKIYWVRVDTRDGTTGNIILKWDLFFPIRLGSCPPGCPTDFASDKCEAQTQIGNVLVDDYYSFGEYPILCGYYRILYCGGTVKDLNVSPPINILNGALQQFCYNNGQINVFDPEDYTPSNDFIEFENCWGAYGIQYATNVKRWNLTDTFVAGQIVTSKKLIDFLGNVDLLVFKCIAFQPAGNTNPSPAWPDDRSDQNFLSNNQPGYDGGQYWKELSFRLPGSRDTETNSYCFHSDDFTHQGGEIGMGFVTKDGLQNQSINPTFKLVSNLMSPHLTFQMGCPRGNGVNFQVLNNSTQITWRNVALRLISGPIGIKATGGNAEIHTINPGPGTNSPPISDLYSYDSEPAFPFTMVFQQFLEGIPGDTVSFLVQPLIAMTYNGVIDGPNNTKEFTVAFKNIGYGTSLHSQFNVEVVSGAGVLLCDKNHNVPNQSQLINLNTDFIGYSASAGFDCLNNQSAIGNLKFRSNKFDGTKSVTFKVTFHDDTFNGANAYPPLLITAIL